MKNRYALIIIPVVVISLLIIVLVNNQQKQEQGLAMSPPEMTEIHQHATMLFLIHGEKFDFNNPKYRQVSYWINFKSPYDDIIHIRDDKVTIGYLFETFNFKINQKCIEFANETSYCTNDNYSTKYFVNGNQINDISGFHPQDGDRILISYGNETNMEINQQLEKLNSQPVSVDLDHLLQK